MAISNDLSFLNAGLKVFSSEYATEEDGYEYKEVMVKRGGFWERLFDTDPTLHLWDDYKPVMKKVPIRKPVMYRIHNMIISHPDLIERLAKSIASLSNAATKATSSISSFSESYKEFFNEKR